jgi:uncharacterized protein (DUF58 family)
LNQLLAPHPVWVALAITLLGLYGFGLVWVRYQAPHISLARRRISTILVAGDVLQEEFDLQNDSPLPVLWAEFLDSSDVPGYNPGRVVACGANSTYRWRAEVVCRQRGVFRLGPDVLHLHDPLGLFSLTFASEQTDAVLIYPRVVQLPAIALPHGDAQGADRRRRPLRGTLPAATVSDYRPGDSLRYVHWATTAHRGRLMVKDLEIEPSGDLWIALDLDETFHEGEGPSGTLEYAVMIAASLAAEALAASDRRAVGLLAVGARGADGAPQPSIVAPQTGQAHLWQILAALAPIRPAHVALGDVLASNRTALGRRASLIVVTPQTQPTSLNRTSAGADHDWTAELFHLKALGVDSSVVLVRGAPERAGSTSEEGPGFFPVQEVLARAEIPSTVVAAGSPLSALLTFRRTRKVVRSTPTGGVVTYEVDEEVG